jgi:hypothetical protein
LPDHIVLASVTAGILRSWNLLALTTLISLSFNQPVPD